MVQANDKLVPPPKVGFSVLFFFSFLLKPSNRLDQAVVTLKSSSVEEGQQGFHLRTSGFEPRISFEVLRS